MNDGSPFRPDPAPIATRVEGQTGLPEGAGGEDLPKGFHEGLNDWKKPGYGGPCPPGGRRGFSLVFSGCLAGCMTTGTTTSLPRSRIAKSSSRMASLLTSLSRFLFAMTMLLAFPCERTGHRPAGSIYGSF